MPTHGRRGSCAGRRASSGIRSAPPCSSPCRPKQGRAIVVANPSRAVKLHLRLREWRRSTLRGKERSNLCFEIICLPWGQFSYQPQPSGPSNGAHCSRPIVVRALVAHLAGGLIIAGGVLIAIPLLFVFCLPSDSAAETCLEPEIDLAGKHGSSCARLLHQVLQQRRGSGHDQPDAEHQQRTRDEIGAPQQVAVEKRALADGEKIEAEPGDRCLDPDLARMGTSLSTRRRRASIATCRSPGSASGTR